ncbi:MAG: hypothetical protein IPM50_14130 [Acidobacteriota bacterium]|nr:MAG: hypothetical protein IPM50_14130 [Acidobacteriota bacterium]
MNTKYVIELRMVLSCLLICGFVVFFTNPVIGQEVSEEAESVTAPSKEEFKDSDGLATPWVWWNTACSLKKELNCRHTYWARDSGRSFLSFFDSDGKLWYSYDCVLMEGSLPKDFDPIGFRYSDYYRIVGESKSWYKVEINERTRETKYIVRSDPNWVKISWAQFFTYHHSIYISGGVKLRDKPNGDVIEEYRYRHYDQLHFNRLEGEWMRVRAKNVITTPDDDFFGWIRWRDGREILIGSFLSKYKIPKSRVP